MLKNRIYAVFKNKEYPINKLEDGSYRLSSDDPLDQQYGFIPYIAPEFFIASDGKKYKYDYGDSKGIVSKLHVKIVTKDEVECVYSIHTFGIYKGHKLRVESEKDNELFLVTSDLEALKACNLEWLDRGFYGISLDKSEVTLFEEKELMPNFFGEND